MRKFFLHPWFQLALSILCVTASELFLKRGVMAAPRLGQAWNWTGISGLASPLVWAGIVFVIISFVSWLYVLRFIPLTIAFPLSQFVHVLIPLCSWLVLHEEISLVRGSGILLVVAGICVVAQPVARLEEKL